MRSSQVPDSLGEREKADSEKGSHKFRTFKNVLYYLEYVRFKFQKGSRPKTGVKGEKVK